MDNADEQAATIRRELDSRMKQTENVQKVIFSPVLLPLHNYLYHYFSKLILFTKLNAIIANQFHNSHFSGYLDQLIFF